MCFKVNTQSNLSAPERLSDAAPPDHLNATMEPTGGGADRARRPSAHREAARFATTADQDTSPFMAVLHMTYANAYLNAARQVGSDAALERASGCTLASS